jgi:hypothetical protein
MTVAQKKHINLLDANEFPACRLATNGKPAAEQQAWPAHANEQIDSRRVVGHDKTAPSTAISAAVLAASTATG